MKKLYFLLVIAALFFTSTTASAQFLNQGGRGSSSAEVSNVMNFADITYSPVNFKAKGDGSSIDIFDLNAISLNWGQARNIMNILPLYVHYGFNLQYAWKTDKDEDGGWTIKETCSFLTAKIPVNLLYNLNIPNTAVSVMPYVGLNLQGHILGQEKYKLTYDYIPFNIGGF